MKPMKISKKEGQEVDNLVGILHFKGMKFTRKLVKLISRRKGTVQSMIPLHC